MAQAIEMLNRKFGKLTVLGKGDGQSRNIWWTCKCDCGRETTARGDHLRAGNTKSCGKCGAYHTLGLTASTALYHLKLYIGPRYSAGRNGEHLAFGAAFVPESGELACMPRKPTFIINPAASIANELGRQGKIRGKESRASVGRWLLEEKCVVIETLSFSSHADVETAWEALTGQRIEEDSDAPAQRSTKPDALPALTPNAQAGFEAWLADLNKPDAAQATPAQIEALRIEQERFTLEDAKRAGLPMHKSTRLALERCRIEDQAA